MSLLSNSIFFVCLSLYEGFGIPPLEALASGAKKLVLSDIPVMHEIYGENVNYINPYDYSNVKLDKLIETNSKQVLSKYSWQESAKKLYDLIINSNK